MAVGSERRPEQITIGIVTIVATVLAMSFADAVVKSVSAAFTLWQIYVLRSLIVVPVLILISILGRRSVRAGWKLSGWVCLRSLLLALMYVAIYAAVPVLSLSVIAASLYTAPLFIALLSAFLIGEPVGLRRWAGIVIGFAGVLLILKPAADDFTALALIPVAAALLYALAAIITRSRCIGEAPLTLALGLNLALLGVGGIATLILFLARPIMPAVSALPFLFGHWGPLEARSWAVLALLAVLMLGISLGLAKAYQSAPPAIIATFDYCYLPFAAFWSYAIFAEPPDLATVGGMALIAMAGMIVMRAPGTGQRQAEAKAG